MRVILFILLLFVSSTCPSLRIDSKDSIKRKSYLGTNKGENSLNSVEESSKNDAKRSKPGSGLSQAVRTLLSETQKRLKANHLREKLQKDLNGVNAKLKAVPKRRSARSRARTYGRGRILGSDSTSDTFSSSTETKNWKDEWKEMWMKKKIEALNATTPKGDVVNMAAARPWGVPCGDPNLHDMPWGSCMLPMECEAEFRIYRGDYFCGPTQFICCAIQAQTYDMNLGFDLSFEDSAFASDSQEKRNRDETSRERKKKRRRKDRLNRRKRRLKRKQKIKRTIKKIVQEMRKLLNRHYRNRTRVVKKKTKELKKFIKILKKKYKKDREAVRDIHEIDLIKIDAALHDKFENMRLTNEKLFKNSTFAQILSNGTISKTFLRQLAVAYPEILPYAKVDDTRRTFNPKRKDYLDYDVEYGYMYY